MSIQSVHFACSYNRLNDFPRHFSDCIAGVQQNWKVIWKGDIIDASKFKLLEELFDDSSFVTALAFKSFEQLQNINQEVNKFFGGESSEICAAAIWDPQGWASTCIFECRRRSFLERLSFPKRTFEILQEELQHHLQTKIR